MRSTGQLLHSEQQYYQLLQVFLQVQLHVECLLGGRRHLHSSSIRNVNLLAVTVAAVSRNFSQ